MEGRGDMSAVRGIRWKAASVVSGAIIVILWRVVAGAPSTIIQINFAIFPEELVGATVLIDGEDRGRLERRGARTVNGFKVPEGDHTVQLRMPNMESEVRTVTTSFGAVVLMVDFEDRMRDDGVPRTVIVLR
jgi:hypothetical protein